MGSDRNEAQGKRDEQPFQSRPPFVVVRRGF
jgi:hypothetical protein